MSDRDLKFGILVTSDTKQAETAFGRLRKSIKAAVEEGEGKRHKSGHGEGGFAGMFGSASSTITAFEEGLEIANQSFERLAQTGEGFMEAGVKGLEVVGKTIEHLYEQGGEFEASWLRLMGTGKSGAEARGLMEQAVKYTQKLPIAELDAVRMVQTFAIAHINALSQIGGSYDELAKKGETMKDLPSLLGLEEMKKEGPTAASVVTDMLAALGHLGTGYQTQAIHEIMQWIETGTAASRIVFGPWKHEIITMGKSAKTAEKRLMGLMKLLSEKGALGISTAAMKTRGGILSNFQGLAQLMTQSIMGPGDPNGIQMQVNRVLMGIYKSVQQFFDEGEERGHKFLGQLRDAVGSVVEEIGVIAKGLSKVITGTLDFIKDHPGLAKFILQITIAGSAVLVLVGGIMTLAAALGLFVIALIPAAIGLTALGALFTTVILPILPLFVAGIAMATAEGGTLTNVLENMASPIKKITTLFGAASEALRNWGDEGTFVSKETAEALQEVGLLDFFVNTVDWLRRGQLAWERFQTTVTGAEFQPIWDSFSNAFTNILEGIGRILEMFGLLPPTVDEAVDGPSGKLDSLANLIDSIAMAAKRVGAVVKNMLDGIQPEDVVNGFLTWYEILIDIKDVVAFIWHAMKDVSGLIQFAGGHLTKGFGISEGDEEMAAAGDAEIEAGRKRMREAREADDASQEENRKGHEWAARMRDKYGRPGREGGISRETAAAPAPPPTVLMSEMPIMSTANTPTGLTPQQIANDTKFAALLKYSEERNSRGAATLPMTTIQVTLDGRVIAEAVHDYNKDQSMASGTYNQSLVSDASFNP